VADLPDNRWRENRRAGRYLKAIEKASKKHGIPVDVLGALLHRESKFRPGAISPSGAIGIAQIVPKFHPDVNPLNPEASIDYAAKYLAANLKRFKNPAMALAAYNHGPTAVAQYGDKWLQMIPKETKGYVESIGPLWPPPPPPPLPVQPILRNQQ
jgi:soluble lytic murein transglycosylase-like protein